VGVRNVRRSAAGRRGRNDQDMDGERNGRETERLPRRRHIDLRLDCSAWVFLMIGGWTRAWRDDGPVVTLEMRVQRLTVVVRGVVVVEVHVHQWRGNRATLHEDDEGGRGQPSKHRGIVANARPRHT
jgi:hypothetical protein